MDHFESNCESLQEANVEMQDKYNEMDEEELDRLTSGVSRLKIKTSAELDDDQQHIRMKSILSRSKFQ